MERCIVAASTFHFHSQKSSGQNVCFGGHRNIVFRSHRKSGSSTSTNIAFHANQLGHKAIHRFVLEQCVMDPPSKWTRVIQRWLEYARVFRKNILPVTRPMISPTIIIEQLIDYLFAFARIAVLQELASCFRVWYHTDRIEINSTQEGCIAGQSILFRFQIRIDKAIDRIVLCNDCPLC